MSRAIVKTLSRTAQTDRVVVEDYSSHTVQDGVLSVYDGRGIRVVVLLSNLDSLEVVE